MAYGIVFPKDDSPRVYLSTVNTAIEAKSFFELDSLLTAIMETFNDKGRFLVLRDETTECFRTLDRKEEVEGFVELCLNKRQAGKPIEWGVD